MIRAATFAIDALTVIFLVGMVGAAVVVFISFFDDIGVLFSSDKPENDAPHLRRP